MHQLAAREITCVFSERRDRRSAERKILNLRFPHSFSLALPEIVLLGSEALDH